jgi:hypothetical protein
MAYFVSTASVRQNMQESLSMELLGEELRRRIRLIRSGYDPENTEVLDAAEREVREKHELDVYLVKVIYVMLKQCGAAYGGKSIGFHMQEQ